MRPDRSRCLCGAGDFTLIFRYTAPPAGETRWRTLQGNPYRREVFRCDRCGHCLSIHHMGFGNEPFYEGTYVDSTYGSNGMGDAFRRITSLEEWKSDNAGRVRRIVEFARGRWGLPPAGGRRPSVLDVGSGLCVFLHRMKAAGWSCTALDPDARSILHARRTVGVRAIRGDFMRANGLGRFDLVTFNKVLEHVPDPVAMLTRAGAHLKRGGFIYAELPDGEAASLLGKGRGEFFIEHFHVFSFQSAAHLIRRAGFEPLCIERLREPSGKFTLRAFLAPRWTRSTS